jgi:hypothetical protein
MPIHNKSLKTFKRFGGAAKKKALSLKFEPGHEATELELYAFNTSELHPQYVAICKNYQKKRAAGVYDKNLAIVGFRHWVDNAAKMYCKEFGGIPAQLFPGPVRNEVARIATESCESERY